MVRVIERPSGIQKVLGFVRNSKAVLLLLFLIVGTFITLRQLNVLQDIRQRAEVPSPHRIFWQNQNWYVQGVNVPWYNWGCDFGCNATIGKSGGVSTNTSALSTGFSEVLGNGMHVVRWWVFPGDPWQIESDANGPTGINPAVYTDFDAALQLAQQYDLYYDFVLFSSPTAMTTSWETDSTQRAKLVTALGTLFAHYKGNPRILSWEPYNEPENDIWNNRIAEQPVVDTGTAIAASVHTNSPGTFVTIGSLMADGMKLWLNAGLDYYSPHWYDYMSSGDYCMICHTYDYYTSWGVTKPIVVGEFYTGDATTSPYNSTYRYNYFYNNGYAGSWGWSLFPNQTSDKMAVDFAAAKTFTSLHTDIGPIAGGVAISPTPTIAGSTPTPTTPVTVTPVPSTLIDIIAPTVSITSPLTGSTVYGNRWVTIAASASDNVKVTRVEFYVNGSLLCTDINTSYTCRWRTPRSSGISSTLTTKAYDAAGNVGISAPVVVTTK